MRVNAGGAACVAGACAEIGARMVYISTDYVFSDARGAAPHETDEPPDPQNCYGRGKAAVKAASERFFIVRSSWMFGVKGKNFIKAVLNLARAQNVICVVSDQTGSPTYTADLAVWLLDLVQTEKYGVYSISV